MIKVLLLENYQENRKGDIIALGNNIAFGLIEKGICRATTPNDFIKKTEYGETKAFSKAPSKQTVAEEVVDKEVTE